MLRVAIIGTGNIALSHLKAYQELRDIAEIVALCDSQKDILDKFLYCNKLSIPSYLQYQELLEKIPLDVISVCTPPFTHKEICIAALKAGVHVFCEKPMAPSVADCEEMIMAQKESGKLLGICHQNRFRNDIQEVKYVLDTQILGKILFARIDSFWWRAHSYYDLWWRGLWEKEGGGCMLNHAVHHVDLMLWFLGKPQTIQAICANQAHDNAEVEDFVSALIQFENNTIAQLTGSVICHGEEQQLYFQCEKGKIAVPWDLYCSLEQPNGFPCGRAQDLENEILALRKCAEKLKWEHHTGIIANFLNGILGKESILVTGLEGKKAIEFITATYQISVDRKSVPYVIDKQHPWYTYQGILDHAPRFYEKTSSVESLEGSIVVGSSREAQSSFKGESNDK